MINIHTLNYQYSYPGILETLKNEVNLCALVFDDLKNNDKAQGRMVCTECFHLSKVHTHTDAHLPV